jgi:C4-dicarboxylate transporter, DctM subunit
MILALGILPLVLLLLGFPIFLVLLTASTVALLAYLNIPYGIVHQTIVQVLSSPSLLAIPFFVLAGELMSHGSIAKRLVGFVESAASPVRGNLAVTTIGTSAIFGAISGVSVATVVTIGRIMYPAMLKGGYPQSFAAGLVTAVGAIDIIIPPSVAMIVYCIMADESVPRLYAAGIGPGLLLAVMLAAYVIARAWWGNYGTTTPFNLSKLLAGLKDGIWALGMPLVIFAGIYGGVFSPTEAAAVACIYAAIVTRFIYRELTLRDILAASERTVIFAAQILLIAACAGVFSWLLTINQVPAAIVGWIQSLAMPLWLLLLVINVVLLAIGCFLDPLSSLLLLTPLLVPIVKAAGIDTVHFGIIMTVNLAIGLFHPPMGMNIFVAQSVLRIPLAPIYRGIIPFLVIYLVALMLITYVPSISLYGVKLLMGIH